MKWTSFVGGATVFKYGSPSLSTSSDWDSLCVHDGRYDIELFNYDFFHPTSFTAYNDDEDSNGEYLAGKGSRKRGRWEGAR